MTFGCIIYDFILNDCIKMPHCCSVGSPFHMQSDKNIKSPSQAISAEVKEVEKWSWKLAINIQAVLLTEGRSRIPVMTIVESACDGFDHQSFSRTSHLFSAGNCNGQWRQNVKLLRMFGNILWSHIFFCRNIVLLV